MAPLRLRHHQVHTKYVVLLVVVVSVCFYAAGRAVKPHSPQFYNWKHENKHDVCRISRQYFPSKLENAWLQNVEKWQTRFCGSLKETDDSTTVWLEALSAHDKLQASHLGRDSPAQALAAQQRINSLAFSRFVTTYDCGGGSKPVQETTWIEPLSHGLRHPNALCNRGADIMDRSYLLLAHASEVATDRALSNGCVNRTCQAIYFDLGATTLQAGPGEAGQGWFFDAYRRQGIEFDRYLLWEAKPQPPEQVFANLPRADWHKYQYYNVPVSADLKDPANPINILKAIAQPGDFVAFKLDIDTASIESDLVQVLLTDEATQALVDEFFFEEHVKFADMLPWWADTVRPGSSLADSYRLFSQLRQRGIRAHSWV